MNKRSVQTVKGPSGARPVRSSATHAVSRSAITEQSQRLAEKLSGLEADLALYRSALDQSRAEMQAFAYSVSHDLRAPLRAIEGFARILLDDFSAELNPDGKRFLKNIVTNAETLSSQIEDLLRFYRLGKNPPTKINSDADAIAREAIANLPSKISEKVRIPSRLPQVSADPVQLREIFTELLRNALKFSSNAAAQKIEIRSFPETDALRFSVSDNGVGFDPKYGDRLFQVFQKLHPPSEYSGNGIGLAIVKRLVQGHGGCVSAESAPNKGATFSFTLPRQST